MEDARRQILAEVVAGVRASPAPVPLEALADRALRALGHEKTIATGWAGAGSFRELLRRGLPDEIRLTDEPPYLAYDARRHIEPPLERRALEAREPRAESRHHLHECRRRWLPSRRRTITDRSRQLRSQRLGRRPLTIWLRSLRSGPRAVRHPSSGKP